MQVQITVVDKALDFLPVNDLNLYMELGHEAGKQGKIDESYAWYMKGLRKARELQNQEKISKFSALIITLL
ncbi:MAG: hypothetical protein ACJAUV_002130 [Flavobacteriales bacterium]|jgi:hypothetical protein